MSSQSEDSETYSLPEEEMQSCATEILSAAEELVYYVLCTAKSRLESDPTNVFFYKKPIPDVINYMDGKQIIPTDMGFTSSKVRLDKTPAPSSTSLTSMNQRNQVQWCTIRDFDPGLIVNQISEYIESWKLSPNTKYVMEFRNQPIKVSNKGTYYDVWVYFHKPTDDNPNPLARAKVFFRVTVPLYLPDYYEVMVTYRFEGFNTLFYALGNRALNSTTFQRFYIDTILEMKLAFYSEVYHCTHPDDCPNCKPMFRRECPEPKEKPIKPEK